MSGNGTYRPKREGWADPDPSVLDANLREELEYLGRAIGKVDGAVTRVTRIIDGGGGGGGSVVDRRDDGGGGDTGPDLDEKVKVDSEDIAGYLFNKIYGMPPYVNVTKTPDGTGGSFLLIQVTAPLTRHYYVFQDCEELDLAVQFPHPFYDAKFYRPVTQDTDPDGLCLVEFIPQTVRQYANRIRVHFGASERGILIVTGSTEPVVPW